MNTINGDDSDARPPEEVDFDDTGAQGFRVLAVDDDPSYLAWVRHTLGTVGLRVRTALRGEEAIEVLRESDFDILMVDLRMPALDGYATLAKVREQFGDQNLYALLVSGDDSQSTRLEALARGFDDFVPKSADQKELLARLQSAGRILRRQRLLQRENAQLRNLATTDELTGCANRRHFFERLDSMLRSDRRPVNIAIFDLDDFKRINDTHGHVTGDRVLRDVGELLRTETRLDDVVARYGGDEFAMLIPGVLALEAALIAERIRGAIHRLHWPVSTEVLTVTASVGVLSTDDLPNGSATQLLDLCDKRMYERKRNRAAGSVITPLSVSPRNTELH
jgi:two-component system, cell cycle response regulator